MKQLSLLVLLSIVLELPAQVNSNNDMTAPVINITNTLIFADCDEIPQPDASVYDNLDPSPVLNVAISNTVNTCNLITPLRPLENLCNYAVDWALYLVNQPIFSRYYQVIQGEFVTLDNGTAYIFMTTRNPNDSTAILEVTINLVEKMNWSEWSALERGYKHDCNVIVTEEFPNWDYYKIDPSSVVVGHGSLEGTQLSIAHSPSTLAYGYQVGIQSNNYNPDYGSGGWFTYSGTFAQNGVSSTVSGAGDVALKHDCAVSNSKYITYNYTATDVCGNTSTEQQLVVLCDEQTPFLTNLPLKNKVVKFCDLESILQPIQWNVQCESFEALPSQKIVSATADPSVQLLSVSAFVQTDCSGLVSQSYQLKVKNGPSDGELTGCADLVEDNEECSCCVGDMNGDRIVGTTDLLLLISNWGLQNYQSDFDLDGIVGTSDLLRLIAGFGNSCD